METIVYKTRKRTTSLWIVSALLMVVVATGISSCDSCGRDSSDDKFDIYEVVDSGLDHDSLYVDTANNVEDDYGITNNVGGYNDTRNNASENKRDINAIIRSIHSDNSDEMSESEMEERRRHLEEDDEGLGVYDETYDEHYSYGEDNEDDIYDDFKLAEDEGSY